MTATTSVCNHLLQVGNRDQLQATRERAMTVRMEAQRAQDEARGSLSVVVEHTKEAKRNLADPKYHQIHARYRRQLIEVRYHSFLSSFNTSTWLLCG